MRRRVGRAERSRDVAQRSPPDTRPQTPPGFGTPDYCAADDGCTTRQLKTHSTGSRVVCYRFHPWYGLAVFIRESVVRGGSAVFRCSQEPEDLRRSLEIPQWMFDRSSCCTVRVTDTPVVDWRALIRLRDLLAGRGSNLPAPSVQHQHRSSETEGDADAQDAWLPSNRSVGVVSPAAPRADLGSDSARSQAEGHHPAGEDVGGAPHTAPRRGEKGAAA